MLARDFKAALEAIKAPKAPAQRIEDYSMPATHLSGTRPSLKSIWVGRRLWHDRCRGGHHHRPGEERRHQTGPDEIAKLHDAIHKGDDETRVELWPLRPKRDARQAV